MRGEITVRLEIHHDKSVQVRKLRVDVRGAAENREPGTFCRAAQLFANADVNALADLVFRDLASPRECAADAGQAQGYNWLADLPGKHTGRGWPDTIAREIFVAAPFSGCATDGQRAVVS